jgi:hypothetical protein
LDYRFYVSHSRATHKHFTIARADVNPFSHIRASSLNTARYRAPPRVNARQSLYALKICLFFRNKHFTAR